LYVGKLQSELNSREMKSVSTGLLSWSRIKTRRTARLRDNSINANYRELAGRHAEQRRQVTVRVIGVASRGWRRELPRDKPLMTIWSILANISHGASYRATSPPRYSAIVFAIGTSYRRRHLFKCNISPSNEDYLPGKCVPQVLQHPSSSELPFSPWSRCHSNEEPFVYGLYT